MQNTSQLRVLHIIDSVNPAQGGPVQALLQTLMHLSDSQHIETICLDHPDSDWLSEFAGIVHPMGRRFKKYGYTPKLIPWIKKNAKRFDVAVIHGLWNHASVGGGFACKEMKLPYVVFAHGMMGPWFKKTQPLKHFAKQLFWLLQGRVMHNAHEVLFTCEEEKNLAKDSFFGYSYNAKVVAFGAEDGRQLIRNNDYSHIYDLMPQLKKKPYLLYLSRIHEIKGCDLLLEAFSKVTKHNELNLVMAGPGNSDLINELKLKAYNLGIADKVHWPGMLKNEVKLSAFIHAEAFTLFSHHENFGIAVAEALSFGKPVLISEQVNIWREIIKGKAGIAAVDTVEGATEILAKWTSLSDFDKEKMAINARNVYETHFRAEVAAEHLTDALIRAIKKNSLL